MKIKSNVPLDFLLEGFIDDLLINSCQNKTINQVVLDHRKAKEGDLFIACQGYHTHGLLYAKEAVAKGASVILHDGELDNKAQILGSISDKILCLKCDDLKNKIGEIASRYYEQPSLTLNVIGVTGTDGKTSIVHYLAQCLDAYDVHCGVLGTLGNGFIHDLHPTGLTTADALLVQKTLAEIKALGAEHVVMEVSSHGLSQGRVNGVAFNSAVFSNIATDHLDYHGTIEKYIQAKKQLFYTPGLAAAIINLDDKHGRALAKEISPYVCVWGYSLKADISDYQGLAEHYIHTLNIEPNNQGYHLTISTPQGNAEFPIPLFGRFNVANALAVLTTLLVSKMPFKQALASLSAVHSVNGRVEMISEKGKPVVVVDYAHTEQGLAAVCHSIREHFSGDLWCVFGCGGDRDKTKRPLMAKVAQQYADKIIVTSDNPRHEDTQDIIDDIMQGFTKTENIDAIADRRQAIDVAISNAKVGDVVLLAGKGHETSQIVGDVHIAFDDCLVAKDILRQRESEVMT